MTDAISIVLLNWEMPRCWTLTMCGDSRRNSFAETGRNMLTELGLGIVQFLYYGVACRYEHHQVWDYDPAHTSAACTAPLVTGTEATRSCQLPGIEREMCF